MAELTVHEVSEGMNGRGFCQVVLGGSGFRPDAVVHIDQIRGSDGAAARRMDAQADGDGNFVAPMGFTGVCGFPTMYVAYDDHGHRSAPIDVTDNDYCRTLS